MTWWFLILTFKWEWKGRFCKQKMFVICTGYSCRFLNPNNFLQFELYVIVLFFEIWETSRNKLKKHSVRHINGSSKILKMFQEISTLFDKQFRILWITRNFSRSKNESISCEIQMQLQEYFDPILGIVMAII